MSTMDTRTLRVPKSTPATIAKRFLMRHVLSCPIAVYAPCAYISQPKYFVAASCTTGATVEKFAAT